MHGVSGATEIPSVLAGLLESLGARSIALSDAVQKESWVTGLLPESIGPEAGRADLFAADAGITHAQAGIAETGTLLLASDVERHRLTSLVPEVHIAILDEAAIAPTLDDALGVFAQRQSGPPRCVTLITGPSRTADIELELVIGVHGPRALHVLLVESSPSIPKAPAIEEKPTL